MTSQTNSIFLTRSEYDTLIVFNPTPETAAAYLACERKWSIGGVRLTGRGADVAKIHLRRVLLADHATA